MVTEQQPKGKLTPSFIIGQHYHWPCQYCDKPVWSKRGLFDAFLDCTCPQGDFMRVRGLADDRQKTQERTNKLSATDLEERELVLKEKLMARRESRQEEADSTYDVEDTEPEATLDFASFGQEVTLQEVEKLPSAFVRGDGETLLYAGVANTIFGEPSLRAKAGLL